MGGYFAGQPTIGGTYQIPGLQLSGLPNYGLFSLGGGLGLSLSANIAYYQSRDIYRVGSYTQPDGNFGALTGSPFALASAHIPTVDPSGKFLYVASGLGIYAYEISPTTGLLTAISGSPYIATQNITALATSPDGNFLYASDGLNTYGFSINRATGVLTAVPGSPFAISVISSSNALAVSTDSAFLYASNNNLSTIRVYSIATNGSLTEIAGSPFSFSTDGLSIHESGNFIFTGAGAAGVSTLLRNTTTGALSLVVGSPFGGTVSQNGFAADPLGDFLYVSDNTTNSVYGYTVDSVTGKLYAISGSPWTVSSPLGLSIDPTGAVLSVGGSLDVFTFTIDRTTGALTPVSSFSVGSQGYFAVNDPTGKFIYVTNSAAGSIYGFSTTPTIQLPLMEGTFDPSGAGNNFLNVNGTLTVNGAQINALPSGGVANAGKFLRLDATGTSYVWDGVNTNVAVAMVANAGAFTVEDSGNYQIEVTGALTANGALTATLSVPADATQVIFDNSTTGGFAVVLNGTWTIPTGKSVWYWNGTTFEQVGGLFTGSWTPTLTFVNPGDLAVAYSSQLGSYSINGRQVHARFQIATSSFTWTTASGSLQITGLPSLVTPTNEPVIGSIAFQGITKASYTHYATFMSAGAAIINVTACGSGVTEANIVAGDMPSGGSVVLRGEVSFSF